MYFVSAEYNGAFTGTRQVREESGIETMGEFTNKKCRRDASANRGNKCFEKRTTASHQRMHPRQWVSKDNRDKKTNKIKDIYLL